MYMNWDNDIYKKKIEIVKFSPHLMYLQDYNYVQKLSQKTQSNLMLK